MPEHPSADLIESHRLWLIAGGFSRRTSNAACETLYRVDQPLAPHGLAAALPEELTGWLASNPDWSPSTRATYRQHIRRFYLWATDADNPYLSFDPSVRLRRPRVHPAVPNPASDEEVRTCMTRAIQPWLLHCVLAAYAGLRPIEIADLRREDITEDWIRVRSGKGAKPAVIPTEAPVWRAVANLPPGWVTSRPGHALPDAHWVSVATARYLRQKLDVPISLGRLRHWHATWLRRHHDLRIVQERMRHASVLTTQGYTAVSGTELARSVGSLPDFTSAV